MFKEKSLSELNRLAQSHSITLEDCVFSAVKPELFWSPETVSPFYYLPSYKKLDPAARLRYNQLFSLGIAEQFVWFERDLISPVLRRCLEGDIITGEFRQAICNFIKEEEVHTEMFWRLLETAAPERYKKRGFSLLKIPKHKNLLIAGLLKYPDLFLVWILMAIFFEERTLDYSRRYLESETKKPGLIDANFMRAHRLHMIDESRHFQMDVHFLREFYDHKSWVLKKLAAITMQKIVQSFASPKYVSARILSELFSEKLICEKLSKELKAELKEIHRNPAFIEMAFGPKSIHRTREIFSDYPELRPVLLFPNN